MILNETKISGKLCIFLEKIDPIEIQGFIQKANQDFFTSMNEASFRFYSLFLKQERSLNSYPLLRKEDLPLLYSQINFIQRFNRLKNIANHIYFYTLKSFQSNTTTILEYAKQEGIDRVLVFYSKHLLRDEKRLLKAFKLNSFLYYRDANMYNAQNLFNPNGYIHKKRLESLLLGKAKFVSESTMKMIELEIDQEIGSNLTKISYIQKHVG